MCCYCWSLCCSCLRGQICSQFGEIPRTRPGHANHVKGIIILLNYSSSIQSQQHIYCRCFPYHWSLWLWYPSTICASNMLVLHSTTLEDHWQPSLMFWWHGSCLVGVLLLLKVFMKSNSLKNCRRKNISECPCVLRHYCWRLLARSWSRGSGGYGLKRQ